MQSKTPTVRCLMDLAKDALKSLYPVGEINSIISILFDHYLGFSKADLIIRADTEMDENISRKVRYALQKLQYGIPVQYIISTAAFYGLDFFVDKNVLIPRMETEELVKWIIDDNDSLKAENKKLQIIDIGTGSGCIAVILKNHFRQADLTGVDVTEKILKVAKRNADHHNVAINFIKHNILTDKLKIYSEKFDIIVSNPPYIEEKDKPIIHKNVLKFEPHLALFVPDYDPLVFYRAIIDFSISNLKKGGKVYFEINEKFGTEIRKILNEKGLSNVILRKDLNNKDRMVSAEL
jgi:release factor glutamine methyltransferase